MKKQFEERERVTVYLEREFHDRVAERCKPAKVSALCRHLLEVYLDGEHRVEDPASLGAGMLNPPVAENLRVKPKSVLVQHDPRCPCQICEKNRHRSGPDKRR